MSGDLQFPLDARFKVLAIGSQVAVTDAHGALLFYAKQKAFKLKEAVTVYADEAQARPLFRVAADRILDISARYRIEDAGGVELAVLQRQGMQSFWRAHYVIEHGGQPAFVIQEENPWIKVADGILDIIPLVGLVSGYFFNPAYVLRRVPDGPALLRAVKRPALFEGRFEIQSTGGGEAPEAAVVALLMMLLLERARG